MGIMAELSQELEWSNFKNEAARHQGARGSDYTHALHDVWRVMNGFQEKQAAKSVKKRSQ
jgi:hypothetical protein